jgi:hypothetical protein
MPLTMSELQQGLLVIGVLRSHETLRATHIATYTKLIDQSGKPRAEQRDETAPLHAEHGEKLHWRMWSRLRFLFRKGGVLSGASFSSMRCCATPSRGTREFVSLLRSTRFLLAIR